MSENLSPQPKPEEHLGEVVLSHAQETADFAEDSHDELKQYAREIYEGALDLLDEADGFRGTGPQGWEEGHDAPSYIAGEFKHNVHRRKLDGIGVFTELFTERLRIQQTNVVAPYEQIEGERIRLDLLEIPKDTAVTSYGTDELIEDVKRLAVSISPDGEVRVDTYAKGDGRIWGDVVEGPGSFGHGDQSVTLERLDFAEADAQHVLQLIKEARADVRNGIQLQEHPDTIVAVEKAYEMAHAGKPERDAAASQRAEAEKINVLIDTVPEAAEDLKEPAEQAVVLGREGSYDQQEEKDRLVKKVDELIESKDPEIKQALTFLISRLYAGDEFESLVTEAQDSVKYERDNKVETAKDYDKSAEQREYWAGVLHHNPISEAYKERFGLETVTPEILVRFADEVEGLQATAARFKNDLDMMRNGASYLKMHPNSLEKNIGRMTDLYVTKHDFSPSAIADLAYIPGSTEYISYTQLVNDRGISSGDKSNAYDTAVEQAIKNMSLNIKLKQTFLDDIRSGRAAMWQ